VLHEKVGDLRGEPLLDLRPAGVHLDDPGQLRQAGDPSLGTRDVADVRDALERQQMVFAEAHHLDVADQHQLLVAGLERGGQHLRRVDPQAGEQLSVRPGDPGRGLAQPVAVGVLADRDQDLPHRLLDAHEVDGLLDRGAGELAVDQACREIVEVLPAGEFDLVVALGLGGGAAA
jgi:hypothetical protein